MVPVPRSFPKRTAEHNGRGHFYIPLAVVNLSPIFDERVFQNHAVRQKEGKALSFVEEREKFELFSELGMVALFCLFEHVEIGFHFVLFRKSRTVNTGEHFIVFVPSPIGARDIDELERLDFSGGRKVRTAAKVGKIALFIEGNRFSFGQIFDKFHLIFFVVTLHEFERFFPRKNKTFDGKIALDDLLHLRFDFCEVFLCNGRDEIDVVIESVLDDGTYRELAGGINGFERLCQNVRTSMTIDVQSFLVFKRHDFQRIPLFENVRKVYRLPVHLCAYRVSRQSLGNRRGGLHTGGAVFKLHAFAVFENDVHKLIPPYFNYLSLFFV